MESKIQNRTARRCKLLVSTFMIWINFIFSNCYTYLFLLIRNWHYCAQDSKIYLLLPLHAIKEDTISQACTSCFANNEFGEKKVHTIMFSGKCICLWISFGVYSSLAQPMALPEDLSSRNVLSQQGFLSVTFLFITPSGWLMMSQPAIAGSFITAVTLQNITKATIRSNYILCLRHCTFKTLNK